MMKYNVQELEKKWQQRWQEDPPATTQPPSQTKKFYCLDMFPYPSGSGLHVGHWRGYVLSDVYTRIKWLQGYNILHPMGWDAFGLPAENDALKKGIAPQISTATNISKFKQQLKEVGALYDWSKELNTTDPEFYKWTQWIFIQMYKSGLAYEAETPINWCPSCLTGLANEEVVQGTCERCATTMQQKTIRQWMLRITAYAEKLLEGLDHLNWPDKVKTMQRNWIGKSEGLLFSAPVKDTQFIIQTFSAHFEAFYADTFVVIAPDHPLLESLLDGILNKQEILDFAALLRAANASDPHKQQQREPEGIFTGRFIIDPVTNKELPLWVANFAIATYGTGIIKCSAHDSRDFAFAKKYGIPLKPVLFPPNDPELSAHIEQLKVCYSDMVNGILREPHQFSGRRAGECRQDIIDYCINENLAVKKTNYKLRDWIFSRQRYWGEPIPLIHCTNCGIVPVPENQLPVRLPEVKNYQPTGTGESPLAALQEWVQTPCPTCNRIAQRETNTMPQWAGSSWYFLRYPNPQLHDKPFSLDDMRYWMPVDLYVGGIEHAILHLLYARFYVKVLHDLGYIPFNEPFKHLFNQGMVNKYSEKTGLVEKMSKSKGNVVNPDEIVQRYGSDVLRMYILFIGPPELDCEWQDSGLDGVKRFLNRLWAFMTNKETLLPASLKEDLTTTKRVHLLLKEVHERLELFKPNTALSSFMEWLNNATAQSARLSADSIERILVTLSVMAPHLASELLHVLLNKELVTCQWPSYDPFLAQSDDMNIPIQIDGKTRSVLTISIDATQQQIEQAAREKEAKWLAGKEVTQVIYIPNRLINFVRKNP
jgi:leucyl-tRNA synthetase